jgi:hypothetical protein
MDISYYCGTLVSRLESCILLYSLQLRYIHKQKSQLVLFRDIAVVVPMASSRTTCYNSFSLKLFILLLFIIRLQMGFHPVAEVQQ